MTTSAKPARKRLEPDELVRIKRFMRHPQYAQHHTQNGRRKRRQLNVLSARYVETQVLRPKPGKPHASAASSGSSPSASRSGEPARICSAIRPEFWRIDASIFAVMSGLALRKAFEFSRPWPRRWLS